MRNVFFFATPADIAPAAARFETNAPLKYIETGMRAEPSRPIYLRSADIDHLGIATHGTGSLSIKYMVSHRNQKNYMFKFVDNNGQTRWLLSNGDNKDAAILTPAGLWKTGTLLPGNMSAMYDTPMAQQLMQWFVSALRQERFTKVDLWWLGREALAMLRAGKRLTTTAEQSPPEFDLTWSAAIRDTDASEHR